MKKVLRVLPLLTILMCLAAASPAAAETVMLENGQILETLFSTISNKKEITCAGRINGKYLSGKAVDVSDSKIFIPLSSDLKTLKAKLKSSTTAAAKSKVQKKIDKLKAKMKTEDKACSYGPDGPPDSNPGSEPTPQPTSTPTPAAGNFDSSGNVTAKGKAEFGIPSNLSANRETGRAIYTNSCKGCHESEKTGNSFSYYKNTIQGAPMYIFDQSDQDIANLTAYLRRFELN